MNENRTRISNGILQMQLWNTEINMVYSQQPGT